MKIINVNLITRKLHHKSHMRKLTMTHLQEDDKRGKDGQSNTIEVEFN